MKKNCIKILIATLVTATTLMPQTAFAASGKSVTYSDHGTSSTYTSYGGHTLTATATFYYESNEYGKVHSRSSTSTGTGPSSISASSYKQHQICTPIKTVGNHRVDGYAEHYSATTNDYY